MILAKQEGLKEGEEQGKIQQAIKHILRLARRILGEVSPEIQARIQGLSLEKTDIVTIPFSFVSKCSSIIITTYVISYGSCSFIHVPITF